jgi:F0F1-type ATP synthase delta subunit
MSVGRGEQHEDNRVEHFLLDGLEADGDEPSSVREENHDDEATKEEIFLEELKICSKILDAEAEISNWKAFLFKHISQQTRNLLEQNDNTTYLKDFLMVLAENDNATANVINAVSQFQSQLPFNNNVVDE